MPPVSESEATHRASSASALRSALDNAGYGDVIWIGSDISTSQKLGTLRSGATLASDGTRTLRANDHVWPLVEVGSQARVSGLRVQGNIPLGNGLIDYGPVSLGLNLTGAGAEVDNCELFGWGDAAIYSRSYNQHVHDCDIHHNRQEGIGYGVGVGDGGDPVIEYNTFSHNRHDVSSVCDSCSYEVRNNLHQTPRYGTGVDVHEPGGDDFRIHHNEDRNTGEYAVAIRGTPDSVAEIYNNWYYNPTGNVASASSWPDATVLQTQHGSGSFRNVSVHDNHYGTTAPPSGIGREGGSTSPEPDPDPPDDGDDGNGGGTFDPPESPDDGSDTGGSDGGLTITEEDMDILTIVSSTMLAVYLRRGLED